MSHVVKVQTQYRDLPALVAALEQWPRDGVPNNPGAWLMTTAKRRGIDRIRYCLPLSGVF